MSSADLDRLFELVERNRANDVYGEGLSPASLPASSPVWKSNHDFWVEQLKEETGQSWSEQQYNDAANLINFAEYQRAVLNGFTKFVAGNDDTALTDQEEGWGHASHDLPDTFATVADQIQVRDGIAEQVPAGDPTGSRDGGQTDDSELTGLSKSEVTENFSGQADLAAISAIRSRETGTSQFNQIRSDLYVQTGLSALRPYASWEDFQVRNGISDELIDDLQVAYPDGFDSVDMWVAGLAELSGTSGELSTLQAAISDEVDRLHDQSDDLGLIALLGTDFGGQLDRLTYTDVVDRHAHSAMLHDALAGNGQVSAASAHDRVDAGSSGLTIFGSDGDDVLTGGGRNDAIFGGAGDDTIAGGGGRDVLQGGGGHDKIHGNTGDDILLGGADSDELFGDQGNDTLDGQEGADVIFGGLGDDTIYIDDHGDAVIEAANEGTDTVNATIDAYVLPENVEILIYVGDSSFVGTGNELANYIKGGDNADILLGEAGDDTLIGGTGDDTLIGGSGDDTLIGGDGDDILDGSDGSDLIEGGLGSDVIVIRSADDIVLERAGEGIDTIQTTLESYTLSDNLEILIYVGSGDFTGIGNALDNLISGNDGSDYLSGGEGDDYLSGGSGRDTLDGNQGVDTLDGGDGDDTLDGGDGDDWVIGGQGNDYVVFTKGSDTLVLRQGFGNDVVVGFDPESNDSGGHDRIDVSSYGYTADSLGVDILMIYDGDSTIVRIGADSVRLVLVDIHTMDRQDFIFS